MPWQQHVADVVLEIDPDSGRLVYTEYGLTVPRQSGKSTWVLAKAVHRASATEFFGRRQHLVYTAQTRSKAREKWEQDYADELEASPTMKSRVKVSKSNGNESIRFLNGSRFGIDANTDKAGHGGTLDEAYLDEAFAHPDNRLEQAFRPAMITRRNKQLGWISTAGWSDASQYLQGKRKRALELLEAGEHRRAAYFEWSAPDGSDPSDRDVWRACMPALGHTIDEEDIAAEQVGMEHPEDFARAYLNMWVPKPRGRAVTLFGPGVWAALEDPRARPGPGGLWVSVDVRPDRSAASICCAGMTADGQVYVDVVQHGDGTDWVAPKLAGVRSRHRLAGVIVHEQGPAGALLPELGDVTRIGSAEFVSACGSLYDLVTSGGLRHIGQPVLDQAVASAAKRASGEAFAFSRHGEHDISPLVAAAVAAWGVTAKASTGWMVSLS